jgi:hypothetical protein
MFRQYVAAGLFGTFLKLSDDVLDIETFKPFISDILFEFIKGFIFVLLTYISSNNINVAFIIALGHLLLQMEDKNCLNNPYFVSGMIITGFLCIFLFSYEIFSIKAIIVNVCLIFIPAYIDHKLFPEDFSIKKIIGRFYEFLVAVLSLIFLTFYPQNFVIKEFIYFGICYTFTSVLTMSTQFTKEQLSKINLTKYLHLGKGLLGLFYEETEKKIHNYIDILEKEVSTEEKIDVAPAPAVETTTVIIEDASPNATA